MTPELSERLATALNRGASITERTLIQRAVTQHNPDVFSQLPRTIQNLVRLIETRKMSPWRAKMRRSKT